MHSWADIVLALRDSGLRCTRPTPDRSPKTQAAYFLWREPHSQQLFYPSRATLLRVRCRSFFNCIVFSANFGMSNLSRPHSTLRLEDLCNTRLWCNFAFPLDRDTQLSVMERKPLCVHDCIPCFSNRYIIGSQRPVGDVLVINRIECTLLYNVDEIVCFNDKRTPRSKRYLNPFDEVLKRRDMRECVGCCDG